MSVHTLSPRMVCPPWCDRDDVTPEFFPGAADSMTEHTRQIGVSGHVIDDGPGLTPDRQVFVRLSRYDYETGGGSTAAIFSTSEDGSELGRWTSPKQLREYAALLTAAADELEAAQTG